MDRLPDDIINEIYKHVYTCIISRMPTGKELQDYDYSVAENHVCGLESLVTIKQLYIKKHNKFEYAEDEFEQYD